MKNKGFKRTRPTSMIIVEPVTKQSAINHQTTSDTANSNPSLPQPSCASNINAQNQSISNISSPPPNNNNNSRDNRILDVELYVQEEIEEEKTVSEMLRLSLLNEFPKKHFNIGTFTSHYYIHY